MMNRLMLAALAIAGAISCTPGGPVIDDPDNKDHGECVVVWQNNYWEAHGWELIHDDDRSCPNGVDPNDWVEAGGRIVEFDARIEDGQADASLVRLGIFNTNSQCQSLGSPKGSDEEGFLWADYDYNGIMEWVAGIWVNYEAGTGDPNRDCAKFEVEMHTENTPGAAIVKIDYTVNDQ
jgi:hypothetical protein